MKTLKLLAKHSRREGAPLSDATSHSKALARRPYAPGVHGPTGRSRPTDYGKQLREKQKAKRIYGLNERQFRNVFDEAVSQRGDSGQTLVSLLERRLDNMVYRAGFAKTRAAARQSVSHAHFMVNGKKVNIPSYRVRVGDTISLRENKRQKALWKGIEEGLAKRETPSWVSVRSAEYAAQVTSVPAGQDLQQPFDVKLIVEFYSRQ
ncbi:30S ribosomal protein S4 [Patescibacteria group bacterium]|nr:30S ribosomal protein S4 [Patescibacteria group bacterium]